MAKFPGCSILKQIWQRIIILTRLWQSLSEYLRQTLHLLDSNSTVKNDNEFDR